MLQISFITLFFMVAVPLFFWIVPIIDIVRTEFTGNTKTTWILIVLFLPVLGGILYFMLGIGRGHKVLN